MDLNNLIAECTAYDFKVMLEEKKPKSWLKSVGAFANGLGGSLFFGIDNDGIVKGLDDVQHVCEIISSKIRDYIDPLPEVEMIPHVIDGLHILQLKVNAGHYTPYYYVGDGQRVAFVRVGDESIPATAEQMVRLVLKGTNRSYDSLKSESLAKKGTFVILANTFEERTGKNFQKKFLKSFGLITDDGWLTNGGALFSDDCRLSQSRLYCTRWNGLEKDAAINDAEFSGNILLSTATQFMTIIYSMEYEPTDQQGEQHGTKLGLSWDQVGTKLGLSWDEVEKLFIALQEPKSMGELKDLYGWSNTTKFKAKYVSPLIEKKIVGMTLPDKPTSPKQKYFLTDSGKALLVNVTRNPNAGEEEKLNHLIGNLSEEEKRLALELLQKVQQKVTEL